MRHGANFGVLQDPEEGLSPQGEQEVEAMARLLAGLGVFPQSMVASPKKRAQQTASIVARELGLAQDLIQETPLLKPMTAPQDTLDYLQDLDRVQRLMVCGHLPSLSRLAALLMGGVDQVQVEFDRAGICRLDLDHWALGAARLVWHLSPQVPAALAGHHG